MANALLDRLIVAVFAFVFEKAGNLAHFALYRALYSAACMAAASALSSLSARRYSTGMTLRNFGYQIVHSPRILAATVEPVKRAWREIRRCRRRSVELAHVAHDLDQAVGFQIAGVMVDALR